MQQLKLVVAVAAAILAGQALEVCERCFAFERGAVVFEGRAAIDAERCRLIEVNAV